MLTLHHGSGGCSIIKDYEFTHTRKLEFSYSIRRLFQQLNMKIISQAMLIWRRA